MGLATHTDFTFAKSPTCTDERIECGDIGAENNPTSGLATSRINAMSSQTGSRRWSVLDGEPCSRQRACFARWTLILLSALVTVACDGCMRTESHVDVPTELDELKKLHAPPDAVVDVERKKRSKGGGSCGHSPLCIIVLPVMAYDAMFPEKWDEATLTEKGTLTYVARFETGGDFIESTQNKAGKSRHFGRLDLKKLGKRVLVQVGEAPLGADGKPGTLVKTPILPQVDLLADYEAALAKEKDGDDRGELVVEAATWLRDEALPLVEKHTKDPAESDEQRALIVTQLCKLKDSKARDTALSGAGHSPGLETALAGAHCAAVTEVPAALGVPFAKVLAEASCKSDSLQRLRDIVAALRGMPSVSKVDGFAIARACPDPKARTLSRWALGDAPTSNELRDLARASGAHSDAFVEALLPRAKGERDLLYAALDAKPTDPIAVRVLSEHEIVPDEIELKALVKSYLADSSIGTRAKLLHLFSLVRTKGTSLGPSVASVRAALGQTKEDREVLHIALVVLGERNHAAAAARALDSTARYKQKPTEVSFGIGSLVGYGLRVAGCDAREIEAAYKRRKTFTDASRGPLCTQPRKLTVTP